MTPIFELIYLILEMYSLLVLVFFIMHWLVYFQILNARQPLVHKVMQLLHQMIEPILRRIRRRLPFTAGFDLSPIILILGIYLLQRMIVHYVLT